MEITDAYLRSPGAWRSQAGAPGIWSPDVQCLIYCMVTCHENIISLPEIKTCEIEIMQLRIEACFENKSRVAEINIVCYDSSLACPTVLETLLG